MEPGAAAAAHVLRVLRLPDGADDRAIKAMRLCALYATGRCALEASACKRRHVALEERPECSAHAACGRCRRGPRCWLPHRVPPGWPVRGATRVLAAPATVAERVALRAAELGAAVLGAVRTGERRADDMLLFVRGAEAELSADALLAAAVNRGYTAGATGDGVAGAVSAVVAKTESLGAASVVRVRAFPPALAEEAGAALEAAVPGVAFAAGTGRATHLLDVVEAYGTVYAGASLADDAPFLATRKAHEHVYAKGSGAGGVAICRAYYKLAEVLERYARVSDALPNGGSAVDVGAAPGGWTQVLAARVGDAGRVFAVDPATVELDPFPASVVHVRAKAEEAIDTVAGQLREEGRLLDLIVCDANMRPEAAARVLVEFAPLARDGAWLVLTLKNFCKGWKAFRNAIDDAVHQFVGAGFARKGTELVTHLLANSTLERCVLLELRRAPGGRPTTT